MITPGGWVMTLFKHDTSIFAAMAAVVVASVDPPLASAQQAPASAPEFALEGTTGAQRRLRDYRPRVVVLVYEDRDAGSQNQALKDELARRAATSGLARHVALLPIADLHGYDFWPARGFARDAVVDIARRLGVEILIDWRGDVGRAYRMARGASNVVIVGRDGRVVYRSSGPLDAARREVFFRALDGAIAGP
jgi:hypothetical protein